MMQTQIETAVRQFVAEKFMYREGADALKDDTSFLETGLIDSTGVLELVAFLEETFQIRVADEDMLPDNLDSVGKIANYVRRKLAATPVKAAS